MCADVVAVNRNDPKSLDRMVKRREYRTNYIGCYFGYWARVAYTPPGWSDDHPFLSPLVSDQNLKLGIPLFIEVGKFELPYDDIVQFARKM